MEMAKRIKQLRNELGLTQDELAAKLGVQKSAVAKYENGRVENIKRSTIQAMAKIFNVSPSYVMGFEKESPEHKAHIADLDGLLESNTEYLMALIGETISNKRIKLDLTEKRVAMLAGIELGEYLALEKDHRASTQSIEMVIDALGINFYYFYGILLGIKLSLDAIDSVEDSEQQKKEFKANMIKSFSSKCSKLFDTAMDN